MSRSDVKIIPFLKQVTIREHSKIIAEAGLWNINNGKYRDNNFTNRFWLNDVMDKL